MSETAGYAATPGAAASLAENWSQQGRLLEIETPLGKDKLLLTSVDGDEALSELFVYDLQMLSPDDAITPESLIGRNAKVTISVADGRKRPIHGVISQWRQGALNPRDLRIYHAQMVPWLWYLGQTTDCRIFQDRNVPAIIEEVFETYGFSDYEISVARGDYPKLEYCVQYRETALNFVSRLMEEVGIFYYFRHDQDRHVLVIGDANVSFRDLPDPQQSYAPANIGSRSIGSGSITEWEHRYDFRPGRWAQKDFNFKTPSTDLSVNEKTTLRLSDAEKFERFDYPGRYRQRAIGGRLTRTRMEAEESAYHVVRGAGNYCLIAVGGKFSVLHHPCEKDDTGYVVQRLRHSATDATYLSKDAAPPRYDNWFEAIPYDVPFRPLRVTEKPYVHGPQTAMVVGPSGEQIFTDKYGRVRVQFHWDRYGQYNEKSSGWIRVSHAWAGRTWGGVHLPHVGHEVVVSFLEGDPDCPLVTGRVYNGENVKSMNMPENKTQSGLKDHSGNEILMEGKSGSEDIRVNATKDTNVVVTHDYNETVRTGNRTIAIQSGTHTETIKGDTTIRVTSGQFVHRVEANTANYFVAGNVTQDYDDCQFVNVNNDIVMKSLHARIFLEAARAIQLTSGASQITLDQNGTITIVGKTIKIFGSDAVKISGDDVGVSGGNQATIGVGNQNTAYDKQKVATCGAAVSSSAVGQHDITGALVKIN